MKITGPTKTFDSYKPQHCIAGKISRCNRIISQIYRKYLSKFDITSSQLSILSVTAKKKGVVTQKLLSELLQMEKSTISRNLKRLFDKGYLANNKTREISMTDSGIQLLENVIPEWDKALAETRDVIKVDGEQAVDLIITKLIKPKN